MRYPEAVSVMASMFDTTSHTLHPAPYTPNPRGVRNQKREGRNESCIYTLNHQSSAILNHQSPRQKGDRVYPEAVSVMASMFDTTFHTLHPVPYIQNPRGVGDQTREGRNKP